MRDDALRAALETFIQAREPDAEDVEVFNLARLWGGSSTENWRFDASWRAKGVSVRYNLILRRAPESEVVVTTRANEFHLLKAVAAANVSSPAALWLDEDGAALGGRAAMVLSRLPGRADRNLLTAKNPLSLDEGTRLHLAEAMADDLAALHAIDAGALKLPPSFQKWSDPGAQLAAVEGEVALQEVEPALELRAAAWWLRGNLPERSERATIVHGDFRPANMLVENGAISGLLDWELAHIGDPLEDLGWYLAPNYRREHFITSKWTPEHFIQRYEKASGASIDRAALRFWSTFATFKLCTIALATTTAFRRGDLNRIAAYPEPLLHALLNALREAA